MARKQRPNEGDYLLRAVPSTLKERAIARAKRDELTLRDVCLKLLEKYVAGGIKLT